MTDDAADACKRGFSRARAARLQEEGPLDAIIIGSGMGGLTCGAMLARAGKRVVVLEQHDVAGGCTHSFIDRGYEFDTGLHYVGDVGNGSGTDRIFAAITEGAAAGPVAWGRMDDAYDIAVQGRDRLSMPSGKERLREALQTRFPDEKGAVDRYFAAVAAQQASAGLYFAARILLSLAPRGLRWLASWLAPLMSRPHYRISDRTVGSTLDSIGVKPASPLRGFLTYLWGDYGLTPAYASFAIHAMTHNHFFKGAYFPIGGTAEIARRVVPTIEAHGGAVLVRAPVASLLVEDGRCVGVRMARGDGAVTLRAACVVSAAGASNTFERLVPEESRHLVAPIVSALRDPAVAAPSCAHLMLFVALKGSRAGLGLPACNYWIAPSADADADAAASRADYLRAPLPAVFLSFPSAKDAAWGERWPGKSTAHIIAEAPWALFAAWEGGRVKHRGHEYEQLKLALTEKLLEPMLREFPHLKDAIDFTELGTPLSSAHYLGSARGASYGLAHTPARYRQEWLRPGTPIPNLYLTGQDVVSAGIVGAMVGGFLTALSVAPLSVGAQNWRTLLKL